MPKRESTCECAPRGAGLRVINHSPSDNHGHAIADLSLRHLHISSACIPPRAFALHPLPERQACLRLLPTHAKPPEASLQPPHPLQAAPRLIQLQSLHVRLTCLLSPSRPAAV